MIVVRRSRLRSTFALRRSSGWPSAVADPAPSQEASLALTTLDQTRSNIALTRRHQKLVERYPHRVVGLQRLRADRQLWSAETRVRRSFPPQPMTSELHEMAPQRRRRRATPQAQ